MGERWQRFAAEVGRFLAVGLAATVVALILFNLLVHGLGMAGFGPLNKQPEVAYVLANAVGMVISYRGSRHWAFKHRETTYSDGGRTAYVLINLATMALPLGCLWFSRNVLQLTDPLADNLSANVIGLSLGMVARFYLFRTVVFNQPRVIEAPAVVPVTTPPPGGRRRTRTR